MTGCCRNGSRPSRGQDNNLPAIYYSSSFSDRKKAAKNTPCIFMVCFVTLGSHIVPPPAWRRVHAEFRPGYSGFCPIRSGQFPKLEILQPFYASPFQCLPHLTVKRLFLVSSWNFEYFVVEDPRVPGVSVAISLCFSPGKIPLVDAAPAASMVLAAVSLQCLSSISWESCFLFCQLRSRNPQVLCMRHKQITLTLGLSSLVSLSKGFSRSEQMGRKVSLLTFAQLKEKIWIAKNLKYIYLWDKQEKILIWSYKCIIVIAVMLELENEMSWVA